MQEKLRKVEVKPLVKETKEETLKRLFLENGLVKEDVYKDKRGFVIITRTGIDKIVSKQNIAIAYEPVIMKPDWVVLKATASLSGTKEPRAVMSFGEASEDNEGFEDTTTDVNVDVSEPAASGEPGAADEVPAEA